jgi:hypothetical protein
VFHWPHPLPSISLTLLNPALQSFADVGRNLSFGKTPMHLCSGYIIYSSTSMSLCGEVYRLTRIGSVFSPPQHLNNRRGALTQRGKPSALRWMFSVIELHYAWELWCGSISLWINHAVSFAATLERDTNTSDRYKSGISFRNVCWDGPLFPKDPTFSEQWIYTPADDRLIYTKQRRCKLRWLATFRMLTPGLSRSLLQEQKWGWSLS